MHLLHKLANHNSITLFFSIFYALIFLVLIFLSIWTLRAQKRQMNAQNEKKESLLPPIKISSKDIGAIAGDDKLATQLDLARAYIETGRKQLAKKILADVQQRGDTSLQAEAQRLMQLL